MSAAPNQPGLVSSHAQYVKGAAEETIGNVTGSEPWKASGASDKEHAVEAMKAASASRDPQQQGMGGLEEKAGNLVGCEGMQKEGAQSKQ
ncbi:hypothetical protein COCC4DRAFT_129032 [Bipolaris maydis ATCC 48331]|uniref:CsbD-like domain-containing protein n=2 Tax=Cochliobolus heterostrophus TaxID=5016 RepID=M2UC88_COCH5|nr:uncharacterized protein COCC4DRAFT_129032 [Bipolaris maydis ATCC 48331]EMD91296.1 hypothetical protein COCHEDRAFT_1135663 [Bipolaris maydis C5]KAH7559168.1 hypothetical protein BM1_04105 [Bipolaris maydis]ENI08946.1 hypothetical protein COCC4DRAFT_129032 [Bipolaris maydis ATCC 48331]KAJ5027493.1 hypothetical protein J3E73DRAFT_381236 [Bipolaris maydis]KAJ5058719.1 hypothetical protein J3E74DRAFT_247072 [Bipolaris maydis]